MNKALVFIALSVALGSTPTRASGDPNALVGLRQADASLAAVLTRLAVANDELCIKHAAITGLVIHAAADYEPGIRQEAIRYFEFEGPIGVEAVVPDSPAARASVMADDSLVSIDGVPVDRTATRQSVLAAIDAHGDGPIRLGLRRHGATREATVSPVRGCLAHAEIAVDADRNAGTDGNLIQVNSGLANLVEGDQPLLAAVVAHELAHIVLNHPARLDAAHIGRGLFKGLGHGGRLIRRTEDEADRLSVVLMANAGYDPQAAVRYWQTIGPQLRKGGGFNAVHASWQQRAAALQVEVDDVKRQSARPIVPRWIDSRDRPLDAD